MSKRILSLVLAVVMVMLAVPAIVLPTFAADVPEAGFKTTFSDAEDILPEYQANKANYTTGSIFAFPENWAIGGMSAATWDGNYTVTNTVKNGGEYLNNGTSGWMEGSNGGGWYFASGQLVAAATYIGETEDLNGDGNVDANDRTFKSVDRNIAVRYTAPYFGTVTIDVTKLVFNYTWNAVFAILLNGEPIGQFDTEEFDYATGAGWYVPTATDSTDAIESIVKIDVEKGDKIDFVFRLTGLDATDIGTTFNYAQGKRPANDWGFSVEYEAGYAKVKDVNAWETEKSFDVAYVPGETKYFFTWFDGGVAKASGNNLSADAVAKINPALIKNGIIKETDTLADAWAKWVAYMKEATKITYNSNWSAGEMLNGVYAPVVTFGYISGVGSFTLQGTAAAGNYKVAGWDNQYWITDAGADKQYASAYKFIKDHSDLTDATIVTDIAVPASDEISNNTYGFDKKPTGSTAVSSCIANLDAPLYMRPMSNKGASNSAITWTAPTAGYAKIQISDLSYSENSKTDFAVMLNGSALIDYSVIDLSDTAAAVKAINALLADVEFPVAKGDEVSLVFARVNGSGVRVKLSAKATLDTSRIPPVYDAENKWTGDADSATLNKITSNNENLFLFHWYDAQGNRLTDNSTKLNGYVAKINPYLIENGIVDPNDSYKVAFDKWIANVKELFCIHYNTNWQMGAMSPTGIFEPVLYPGFTSYTSLFNVDADFTLTGWDNQFMVTASSFNAMVADTYNRSLSFVKADALVKDIELQPDAAMAYKALASTSSGWATAGKGSSWDNPYWVRPTANVGSGSYGAYAWTAPVSGVATLKFNGVNFADNPTVDMPYAIMINGQIMKDWTNLPQTGALATLESTVGVMEFPVAEGDQIAIVTARNNGSAVRFDLDVAVSIDTTRVPVVYKQDGVVLKNFVATVGDALPVFENAGSFGLLGYRVNGEFTTTLPETVEGALVIEDYIIKTSASITITSKYAINVYVQADADATGAGVIVGGKMMNGVKQADGSYKVIVANLNVRQLQTASVSYIAYQIYPDGYRINVNETTVSSKALLQAYATGNYDTTTKALANSVLDLAEALRAFWNNGPDLDATIKNHLKGSLTISGNYLSGQHDIYLGTLKQITTGEEAKYIANFKDAVFVPDPTLTEADKVKIGYEAGVNPTSSEYKFAIKAATLNLEDQIGFAFRVVANGANSVSDLRAGGKYKLQAFDGVSYAYYDAFLYEGANKNAKAIIVDGVPASRYDRDFEFTIVEEQADGTYAPVGATMTYSVKAYAVQTFTFGRADYASYFAQALFRLGVVADEYVAAHPVA